MEPNVRKELDVFKRMVQNWADSYLWFVTGDNDDCLIDDLQEDINTYLAPQMRRFMEVGHVTVMEYHEFFSDISKIVEGFVEHTKTPPAQKKEIVDVVGLISQFNIHKGLTENNHGGTEFTVGQKIKMADIAVKLIPELIKKRCKCGEK